MNREIFYIPEDFCHKLLYRRNRVLEEANAIPEAFLDGRAQSPYGTDQAFDVNRVLEIYDCIRMQEGYVLDYVYAYDHYGGEPLVYARRIDEIPLYTTEAFYRHFALPRQAMLLGEEPTLKSSNAYLRNVEFEKSPLGYFQFALFCMTIDRFYLHWHSNYNNRRYILLQAALNHCMENQLGSINQGDIECLRKTDWRPRVEILNTLAAEVVLFNFEMNHGYSFLHVSIEWPNMLVGIRDQVVVKSRSQTLY
jgi:hypothetical protein